jgi:hypothetical protein
MTEQAKGQSEISLRLLTLALNYGGVSIDPKRSRWIARFASSGGEREADNPPRAKIGSAESGNEW